MSHLGDHGLAFVLAAVYLAFLPLPIIGYLRNRLA